MSRPLLFTSPALLLFLALTWIVAGNLRQSDRLNVLIITVESLRADLVLPETVPRLLAAADSGYRFHHHRAVSGWTGTNIVSILTGLSPFETGVHTRGQTIRPDHPLPLNLLADRGYRVEGIQGFMTMPIYRNLGLQVSADNPKLSAHLARRQKQGSPFFCWYHYVHTHLPYAVAEPHRNSTIDRLEAGTLPAELEKRLRLVQQNTAVHHDQARFHRQEQKLVSDLQLSSIKEFDQWFEKFWEFFHNSGLRRNTVLFVTADHGDEHGERGLVGHASTTLRGHLHEEIIQVPLFIWLPDSRDQPSPTVTRPHSNHQDLMPTIFGLLGQDPVRSFTGRDLFNTDWDSQWFGMTSSGGFSEPEPADIRYFEYGTRADNWKLLLRVDRQDRRTARLYDLERDPDELVDRAAVRPEIARTLLKPLEERIDRRILLDSVASGSSTDEKLNGGGPNWRFPLTGPIIRYDDFQGVFKLHWSGLPNRTYILEYQAGTGPAALKGRLEVEGPEKDFGQVSRKYWDTWVVRYAPVRLRVKEKGTDRWSRWLHLEPRP